MKPINFPELGLHPVLVVPNPSKLVSNFHFKLAILKVVYESSI